MFVGNVAQSTVNRQKERSGRGEKPTKVWGFLLLYLYCVFLARLDFVADRSRNYVRCLT